MTRYWKKQSACPRVSQKPGLENRRMAWARAQIQKQNGSLGQIWYHQQELALADPQVGLPVRWIWITAAGDSRNYSFGPLPAWRYQLK